MKFFLGICCLCMMHVSLYAKSQAEVMIVMDMSGSMYGKMADKLKIDYAREAVLNQLGKISSDTKVGLMVMGGQRGRRGCRNYRTMVPLGIDTKNKIQEQIANVKPRGKTPLARALKKAVNTLSSPNEAMLILVSDGKERCGNGAYKVLKTFTQKYPHLQMDVVSMATDEASRDKLTGMAELMHGHFYEPKALASTSIKPAKNRPLKKHVSTPSVSSTASTTPATPSLIKLFASLPHDDSEGLAKHTIYTKKDIQMQSCESTRKKECTISISSGTYWVHSRYSGREHITKLLVLDGMDAFVYTSFQKKSGEDRDGQLSDQPVEMASADIERGESERAFREEERLQEALRRGERRRGESKRLLGLYF